MIIASMIIRTLPEKAEEVVLGLKKLPNVTTHGIHKDENIIAVIEAEKEVHLEDLAKYITAEFDGVLGTYPTFIGNEEQLDENI